MKIKKVSIFDYKSIIDISFDVEKDLTCLIGMIGAGKTSILEAIFKINLEKLFSNETLPNFGMIKKRDLLRERETSEKEIRQLEIIFKCEQVDKNWLPDNLENIKEIIFKRYLDNKKWEISTNPPKDIELKQETFQRFRKKTNDIIKDISNIQMQNVERRPDIKESIQNIKQLMSQIYDIDQHWNDIKNLIEKNNTDVNLKPNVDAKINELEEHKKQIIKFRETTNKYIIYSNIPKPIYWTTKPKIFNSEYIENIVNNNANNTFTAIKHICKLDSNGLKSILSEGIDTRNNYLKEAAQKLSDEFQKNFKMNYTFVLQFNTDDVGNKINLTIMDPITKVEINVVKRSEGLQWILDFYFKMINLTATMSSLTSKILLLDNPAIPIHDIAKEKIRKYIKKLSEEENLQIVYTSHERALVDATNMQNIRLIKKTEKGTVNIKTHDRLPHRIELAQHIGSPGRYGLFGIPFTIFVEGMSDVNILKAFNHLAQKNNKSYLDPNLFAFDDLDGIGNLKYLHKLYDNFNMPCCFIIDSDAEQFKEKYKAFDNKIISIQGYTICKLPNSTIEDMFTSDMYKKLLYYFLDSEYITKLNNVCINEGNTILNLFEISMKKVNISKFDISKQFLLNIDKLWVEPNNKIQIEKSLENYYKLVEKIKTLFDTYMT